VPGRDNFSTQLTAEGREGTQELRSFFDAHGVHFGKVLCSPFLRCRQTAAILAPGPPEPCLEPGLCEVLDEAHGLRDGVGGGTLTGLVARVAELRVSTGGEPLFAVSELQRDEDDTFMQSMLRSLELVKRLTAEHFTGGPVLLLTHGGPAFGIVHALLHGEAVPFDKDRMPEMGCVMQFEEREGQWIAVGYVMPVRRADGAWECHWRRGVASGADHRLL